MAEFETITENDSNQFNITNFIITVIEYIFRTFFNIVNLIINTNTQIKLYLIGSSSKFLNVIILLIILVVIFMFLCKIKLQK